MTSVRLMLAPITNAGGSGLVRARSPWRRLRAVGPDASGRRSSLSPTASRRLTTGSGCVRHSIRLIGRSCLLPGPARQPGPARRPPMMRLAIATVPLYDQRHDTTGVDADLVVQTLTSRGLEGRTSHSTRNQASGGSSETMGPARPPPGDRQHSAPISSAARTAPTGLDMNTKRTTGRSSMASTFALNRLLGFEGGVGPGRGAGRARHPHLTSSTAQGLVCVLDADVGVATTPGVRSPTDQVSMSLTTDAARQR